MPERSGGRLIVEQLAACGAERVFCVPGESYLDVLDALHDPPIRTVVCRQEGGATYMAEADGKLRGSPGVAMVTRGPGAANAMVGVHTSWQDATPLLLVVGLIARGHRGRGAFQEFDLSGWFGTVAKRVEILEDAGRAPELVARGWHEACAGRPGPVVIGLPEDVLRVRADVPLRSPAPVAEGAVGDDDLAALAEELAAARTPLVVLGGSRWDAKAAAAVTAWCEDWRLPLAADFRSQDLVKHASACYAGPLGIGRNPRLARRLDDADLVVAVGAPLGDVTTYGYIRRHGAEARTVLMSPDPAALGHGTALTRHLLASPRALAAALSRLPAPEEVPWEEWTEGARAEHLAYSTPAPDGGHGVDMGVVMAELAARLDERAIVTYGAGNHALWPQRYLRHHRYPSLLAPRSGSMGYGIPAAVTAALCYPDRRVVCVAGDGCFLMNGQ
jgi:acetolactate synthase-1/2/3 large subunit